MEGERVPKFHDNSQSYLKALTTGRVTHFSGKRVNQACGSATKRNAVTMINGRYFFAGGFLILLIHWYPELCK